MPTTPTFAIVGAGLAGAKAAEALRAEGFDGRIVLLGAEPHRPYERPPLSKAYLQGRASADSVFVHPPGWYAEHEIDLRLATAVTGIDRHGHTVATAVFSPDPRMLWDPGHIALFLRRALPVG